MCGSVLQRGHSGDGCLTSSILIKYERSRGHLFVLNWARVRRVADSKRHSLQAVDLSQRTQDAVQIVSNILLPFFGHAGHADPLDGWRCCSQKRVMSRPIQVRQL